VVCKYCNRNAPFKVSGVILLVLLTLNLQPSTLKAQDIHFSQFSFSPANLNPAYTALFDGDVRFVANYRNQWFTVPVNYNTVSLVCRYEFIYAQKSR
jgi:hypothetical protein